MKSQRVVILILQALCRERKTPSAPTGAPLFTKSGAPLSSPVGLSNPSEFMDHHHSPHDRGATFGEFWRPSGQTCRRLNSSPLAGKAASSPQANERRGVAFASGEPNIWSLVHNEHIIIN